MLLICGLLCYVGSVLIVFAEWGGLWFMIFGSCVFVVMVLWFVKVFCVFGFVWGLSLCFVFVLGLSVSLCLNFVVSIIPGCKNCEYMVLWYVF